MTLHAIRDKGPAKALAVCSIVVWTANSSTQSFQIAICARSFYLKVGINSTGRPLETGVSIEGPVSLRAEEDDGLNQISGFNLYAGGVP